MRKLLYIAVALMAFFIGSFFLSADFFRCKGMRYLKLGAYELCIPRENAKLLGKTVFPFNLVRDLDSGENQVLIVFPISEIAGAVPELSLRRSNIGEVIPDFIVLATYLDDNGIESTKHFGSNEYKEIWSGTGKWANRRIEKIPQREWVRVYSLENSPSWWVLSELNDPEHKSVPPTDFWLAACIKREKTKVELPPGCRVRYLLEKERLVFSFRVNENDIALRDELGDYLKKVFFSWELSKH